MDADGDGIYTLLQYLRPGVRQWKPTLNIWQIMTQAPPECGIANDSSYVVQVLDGDVNRDRPLVAGPVCFADGLGTCGPCDAEAMMP
jgi:hypothetical protein